MEANAKTVRALAALSLGIEHADVSFIYLNGEPEKLEEAVRTGLAYRTFLLDIDKAAGA